MRRRCFGTVLLAALAIAGCSESVNGKACPYGVNSGSSNSSSSTSCKVRPAPGGREQAAVQDGSAWRAARAAFAASEDARAPLAGVGLNRWGDVTFTRAEGDGEERLVTYDRSGSRPAQDVPDTRGYVEATAGTPFRLRDVPAAGLPKVLARARRAASGLRFVDAKFGRTVTGTARRWTLTYAADGASGLVVFARGDGTGACGFPRAAGDLPRCGAGELLPTGAGDGLPVAPAAPVADPRLECVKAAGTDVAKLQRCAG